MGSLLPLSQFELLADGLDHPECVTWGPDGFVYAGGKAGALAPHQNHGGRPRPAVPLPEAGGFAAVPG